jgi:hypothetical protein
MDSVRKYRYAMLIIIFILLLFLSSSLQAVGVRPLVINLNMDRGETQQFQLELTPEDTQQTTALNLYYSRQQQTGSLSYEEGNLEEHAVLNWLELPEEVVVPPGEETTVDIEVTAPYDAKELIQPTSW